MNKKLQTPFLVQNGILQHPLNRFEWVYPQQNENTLKILVEEFQIHPVIAQILISRGHTNISTVHQFLYGKLPSLHDPDLIDDMGIAVQRILLAIDLNENILILGDHDVDGMSATALLTEFIRDIGGNVFFNLPKQSSFKKCVIGNTLEVAKKYHCSLIITVDCGISAAIEIEEIVSQGLDVIITDHHEPTSETPKCTAILNPKKNNSSYPNRELAGVGVAFKLAHATTNALIEKGKIDKSKINLKKYLDLVALGTIADMVPLKGENRVLVRYGLKEISKMERTGLFQLFASIGLDRENQESQKLEKIVTQTSVSRREREFNSQFGAKSLQTNIEPAIRTLFNSNVIASKIAPRLNSLGRVADPMRGVEILLMHDKKEAEKLCIELNLNNLKRQKIEREAIFDIEKMLFQYPQLLDDKAIVLHSEKWHPGIIAILAARVAKQTNRPTLILSVEKGIGKGSLRTTPEFPLLEVLQQNQDLLINFGGHNFAAGLTIRETNIPLFKKRFLSYANKILGEKNTLSKIHLDAKVSFEDLTFDLIESLTLLEPFGSGNPHPILYSDVVQTWPPKSFGNNHLKLFFEQNGLELQGVAFGMGNRKNELEGKNVRLRIAFTPHFNNFLSKSTIQLQIKDFQIN